MLASIIPISVYLLIISIMTAIIKNNKGKIDIIYKSDIKEKKVFKIIWWPLFFALIFGLYNKFIIGVQSTLTGDRLNYYIDFLGRKTNYLAFDFFLKTIRLVTDNYSFLLSITTFIACLIIFYAFSKSKYCQKETLVFFLLTGFVFESFTNLKQIIVAALAGLFLVLCIEKKGIRNNFICLLLIVLACFFHSTGFVLIPLYLILKLKLNNNLKTKLIILLVFTLFVFFRPMILITSQIIKPVSPTLSNKIIEYSSEDIITNEDNSLLVAFKGFPFYMLLLFGLVKRKKLSPKEYYNQYLILTVVGSILTLTSIFSYWYIRFRMIFYLPFALLYQILINNIPIKERLLAKALIIVPLALITFRSVVLVYINYGGF